MTLEIVQHAIDRARSVWARRRRRRATLTVAEVRGLTRGLQEEKEALQAFTNAMEEEFLKLGGFLRTATTLARDVRGRSDEVVAAASGNSEDAAIHFAFQLLKKAEDLVHASREQYVSMFR